MALCRQSRGFTLIELSVVLVIVAFILGAVVVGRDLIRGSEIRATISQLDKFNSAVAAFTDKYGYLPGDILGSKAQSFGLYYCSGILLNTTGCGDGNGAINGWYTTPWVDGTNFAGEVAMFWLHLSQAGLIDGFYGAGGDVSVSGATTTGGSSTGSSPPTITATSTHVGEMLPRAKLGTGNYFSVGEWAHINYYILTGVNQITTGADLGSTNNITPMDAYTLDQKIDDGIPTSGTVFALDTVTNTLSGSGNGLDINTASANNCVNGSGTAYNTTSSTYANVQNCSLRIQMTVH